MVWVPCPLLSQAEPPQILAGSAQQDGSEGISTAFEGLIERGVIPLHTGIDVSNHYAVALHPKGAPEGRCVGVGDAPIQRVNAEIKEVLRQDWQRVNRRRARVADVPDRVQGGNLLSTAKSLPVTAISFPAKNDW